MGCHMAQLIFAKHTDVVSDVTWHMHHHSYFGSVGDDGKFILWDIRKAPDSPVSEVTAHDDAVNCLSFSPFNEWTLVTGSSDRTVGLWDLRKLKTHLHLFKEHTEKVNGVQWSPINEMILSSYSDDRRLNVWDLSRIGEKQSDSDQEDGPPELLFIHAGHTDIISDFAWNPDVEWLCGSVAADNVLQIWKIAENIYCDDYFA